MLPVLVEQTEPPPENGITLLELTSNRCHWPHGDPKDLETFRYCGAQTYAGDHSAVYCAFHYALSYRTAEQVRKERAA